MENIWYDGPIYDAIEQSLTNNKLIVITAVNDSDESQSILQLFENELKETMKMTTTLLLHENDENFQFFSSLYTQPIVFPSVFFFNGAGLQKVFIKNEITKDTISSTIFQLTMASVLSQQITNQQQPSHIPNQQQPPNIPSQQPPSQTSSSNQQQEKKGDDEIKVMKGELKRREKERKAREEQRIKEEIAEQNLIKENEKKRKEDEEYRKILIKRIKEEKENKIQQQQEEQQQRELELKQQKQEREEKKQKVHIALRLPNGEIKKEYFEKQDTLQKVYNFVMGFGFDKFVLIDGVKKNEFTDLNQTLENLRFWPSILLHVVIKNIGEKKEPMFGTGSGTGNVPQQTWYEWFKSMF
ncbi:kinesin heavy chain, putative [Entamoeba dispar SAW760]|uniref:Kinesin heavy chain, putative n=1 Tax=Entamoeba dispar (strain ATCC PRA-260 / SAW760) TaxID=370354 RepID=B0EHU6_ENTDS|nr:kinesin heavy chain, putative [Entamoeba dispar SAW760]EDR25890.1 kinesin heavy chain, putative [Entamoeba dispar SAW760]|eukprot:EDR25890.1 kinesin heavy chain, putative [Entamoeba dispar SAW760]